VLLDLARECSSRDTHMMIGYLLSTHKVDQCYYDHNIINIWSL